MQTYWFLCTFLTLALPLTASEKTGNNNQLCVPENMQALTRAQSWPSEACLAKEQAQPVATGRKRVTRARFGATSAPTILNTNMPTGSESGYGTDGSTGGDSDDDNLNSLYFSAHLASTHTIPKHIPANIQDFQDSSENPSPSEIYPPEVLEAQKRCLNRLNVLQNELHAPTMYSEALIEVENDPACLAFMQAELEEACNARKTERAFRTKTKPLKYVTFPKDPVSTKLESGEKKINWAEQYDWQEDYSRPQFQNCFEQAKATLLAAPHRALKTFYIHQEDKLLPLDLMESVATLYEDDEILETHQKSLKTFQLQELVDRLEALKPKKV